jgi:hypothetical protein
MNQKHSLISRKSMEVAVKIEQTEGTWMHELGNIFSELEQQHDYNSVSQNSTNAAIERLLENSQKIGQHVEICRRKLEGGKYPLSYNRILST